MYLPHTHITLHLDHCESPMLPCLSSSPLSASDVQCCTSPRYIDRYDWLMIPKVGQESYRLRSTSAQTFIHFLLIHFILCLDYGSHTLCSLSLHNNVIIDCLSGKRRGLHAQATFIPPFLCMFFLVIVLEGHLTLERYVQLHKSLSILY